MAPIAPVVDGAREGGVLGRPVLSATHLSIQYPSGVTAVHGVSLNIGPGERVALSGPSGSGKSSLLGCLAGHLEPSSGTIQRTGRVAVVYQDLRLIKQRTALANVLDGALPRVPLWRTVLGIPRASDKAGAVALLERVGLGHRVNHRVSRLSGGERQRVAIARALMQEPDVLLADEPIASLDGETARSILGLITDIARERGLTVVAVLHDPSLAEAFFERTAFMRAGALCAEGATQSAGASEGLAPEKPPEPAPERPAWFAPLRFAAVIAVAGLVYAWALGGLDVQQRQLNEAGWRMVTFLRGLMPDSVDDVRAVPWGDLLASLLETVRMSVMGTTAGVALALPLAALAAENTAPRMLRVPMRLLLNAVRTVPSIVWGLLFVAAVGAGPLAGVLALTCYSVGYLTKFFYEALESVDTGPPDALRHLGATGLQRFAHAVWPAARPAIASSSLFMLEYNVRAASVLGIVGAGGIGFYLIMFADFRNFTGLLACLVLLLGVVQAMDMVSKRLRLWLVRD